MTTAAALDHNVANPSPSANRELTTDDLVARARDLIPTLRERANEAAALRRMPDQTLRELREAGLFRAVRPKRFGGLGFSPATLYDIQLELAKGDASVAWVFGVLSVHTWQLALFPEQAQTDVWGDAPETLISSSYMPVAKVEHTEGGVRLSGRWSFSSGCDVCDWVFVAGWVPPKDEGGEREMRTFLVPRADYEIDDNWFVSGLRASGSKDIVIDDVFVPDHRMHRFADGFRGENPGNEINPGPEYRFPFGQVHVRSVSTPALGAARGALELYCEIMKTKVSQATGGRASQSQENARVAAEAEAVLDREELVLRRNFAEMAEYLERGERIPTARRVIFRHDSARAAQVATDVVQRIYRALGARAVFEDHPINRHFQDCHAIVNHHANALEGPSRNLGGVLFGAKNADGFV